MTDDVMRRMGVLSKRKRYGRAVVVIPARTTDARAAKDGGNVSIKCPLPELYSIIGGPAVYDGLKRENW